MLFDWLVHFFAKLVDHGNNFLFHLPHLFCRKDLLLTLVLNDNQFLRSLEHNIGNLDDIFALNGNVLELLRECPNEIMSSEGCFGICQLFSCCIESLY